MTKSTLTRRDYLRGLGWSTVGLTVFTTGCSALNPLPALPHREDPTFEDASFWLSLRPEGIVEIVSPRVEMGQGIATAIKQIVAEEMNMDLEQILVLNPRSDRMSLVKATVGSESVMKFGPLIASAAASLAAELAIRANKQYGGDGSMPKIRGRKIVTSQKVEQDLASLLSPPIILNAREMEKTSPISFDTGKPKTIVGQKCPPHQIVPLVTANSAVFVDDITLENMLYARLVTPPYLQAQLAHISDKAIQGMPGYWGLVREKNLVAIVAENRGVLDTAFEQLEVSWKARNIDRADIDDALNIQNALRKGDLEHVVLDEEIDRDKEFDIDLTLSVPMAAHASMEPRTAVAHFKKEEEVQLEVWTAVQDITLAHKTLVKKFGLGDSRVVVHGHRVGGGFGGKVVSSIEQDAGLISRKTGRPVKLQWTREDEFIRGYHRPPSEHRIRVRMNDEGMIDSWWHAFRSGHVIFSSAFLPSWMQNITSFVADMGAKRGAIPPYDIANKRVEFEDVRLPVKTGPWRGLGATPNCWAIETVMDVLAKQQGADPLAFRRRHLQQSFPRLDQVLQKVAHMSNWRDRENTSELSYGVACGIYKDMAYSATVAEVARHADGSFQVLTMWSAHDCGFVVNPDMVRAQVEGNLLWGIGSVFHEELSVKDNGLSVTNFDSYDWASYAETPEIEIALINLEAPPSGAGETAIVSAAASITNAMLSLTGEPVLRLPVTV